MIRLTDKGLYCAAGDFYIDPWRPVERAVITHGHADHARPGSELYYCQRAGVPILQKRLGQDITVEGLKYGQSITLFSKHQHANISLHSAGHILGSAQVRVEVDGEVWVASGDYKRDTDPSCEPFEVVKCDTFITEATFAMPIYRWPKTRDVAADIFQWWQGNAKDNRPSILFCYSLGKAQRIMAELTHFTDKSVLLHGAVLPLATIYKDAGIQMLPFKPATIYEKTDEEPNIKSPSLKRDYSGELIIAPPGASGSSWMKRFKNASTGFCSGWMSIRGARRRRGYDRGFVVSDHADWASLIQTIRDTGATQILATHGQSDILVTYLNKLGINACALKTAFGDEALEAES